MTLKFATNFCLEQFLDRDIMREVIVVSLSWGDRHKSWKKMRQLGLIEFPEKVELCRKQPIEESPWALTMRPQEVQKGHSMTNKPNNFGSSCRAWKYLTSNLSKWLVLIDYQEHSGGSPEVSCLNAMAKVSLKWRLQKNVFKNLKQAWKGLSQEATDLTTW